MKLAHRPRIASITITLFLLDTDFVHHKHSKCIEIYAQNDEVIENIKHEISNSEQLNKI